MVSNRPFWIAYALVVGFGAFVAWIFGGRLFLGFCWGVTATRLADFVSHKFVR
jgi:hypothetical protein